MNILHLISYGNDNFKNSKVRLFNECIESKFFHNINIYNMNVFLYFLFFFYFLHSNSCN